MTAPLISYRGVYKAYGSHLVLSNINLDVPEHTVTCLIGASGCGKSTLLRCTNLLEEIQHGEIMLRDRDIAAAMDDADDIRKRIGMVFQSYNLFPHRSVIDNIPLAPLRVLKQSRSEAEDRARALLARFGLADKATEYPDRLSGGQQQRVAVIRALAMQPEVLLMDEPFAALDALTRRKMQEELQALWEEERFTLLFVTHSIEEALVVGNRILLLSPHPGRVRAEINSHQFGLHSMGGSEFQSTAKRIHGLLFDEPAQAGGGDAADAGNNLPRPSRAQEA